MLGVLGRTGDFVKAQTGKSALALAAFFGALATFSLPPYPFTLLFMFSLPLVLILLSQAKRGWRAFALGFAFGVGYFGMSLYWVGESFLAQSDVPHWTAPIAVVLLVMYMSLFPALAFMISRNFWGSTWAPRALIFAGIYSFFEWLRGWGELGFPWNTTSSIWWPYEEMIQVAALVGSYGLGALTLLAIGLFVALFDKAIPLHDRFGMTLMGTLMLTALALLGWARLDAMTTEYHEGITLRLVQANIPQTEKWNPALLRRNLDRHIVLSTPLTAEGAPVPYLVWPETAIPFDVGDPVVRGYLAEALGGKVTLISGANRYGGEEEGGVFNSVYALAPGGEVLDIYDKVHLVPFGEYIPFRKYLGRMGLNALVAGSSDFSRGTGLKTMELPGLPRFSPLVCYEIIFPGNVVAPNGNPAWFLNLTNDAWFGVTPGPYQHFEMARMRAVEEGIPVVRVAGGGISGVVDPLGRVTGQLGLGQTGFLDVALPRPLVQKTLYSVYGSIIFLSIVLAFLTIGMIIKSDPKQDRH